jgi:DUF2946 family protein
VLAVLLQIVVPAIHHPIAAEAQSSLFADSVICSHSGRGGDRAFFPEQFPKKSCSHCPICWGLQQLAGGFVVPHAIAAPKAFFGGEIADRVADGTASRASAARRAAQPRGPPHLV